MALKVELKPGEKLIVGETLITNDKQRARFFIQGDAPILREKDILLPDHAKTIAQQVYLAVQVMYLKQDITVTQKVYFDIIGQILEAAPSTRDLISDISTAILQEELYKALKLAKKLIEYERTLISHVSTSNAGVSAVRQHLGLDGPEGTGS
ncbi:flagellum biosynthesis repressor protein FlbT [Pseudovibrio axinellae]|uniref:Flagellum biosynthesis repressor protein FlbT n=1 Tax=Pseudovibrio axinellae TaxID=989403 RepID=A0A166ANS4_9HYPH|nr:flagellar biosynthesis repressor FlbT [Pseudovibrio axinellae]KZL21360.1 flagellum biosynthesis repressor protein FlbT [Pseudovibrio axinellae]SEQ97425.1 flagellar protein FlbT [Pseudovibrio axinellae]